MSIPSIGRQPAQRGAVLIIVVGLAAMLLAIAGAVLAMNRSEAVEGALLSQDAQARLMLGAGLLFIQESSRLGHGVETYGWTDVRDGSAGPRGPRDSSGNIPDSPADTLAKGAAYRGDVYAMRRPPCALRLTRNYNPVGFPVAKVEEWDRAYDGQDPQTAASTWLGRGISPAPGDVLAYRDAADARDLVRAIGADPRPRSSESLLRKYWERKFWPELLNDYTTLKDNSSGLMNPQPVADTLDDFLAGDTTPRPESTGRSWFRVYRETDADHDGSGTPWYNTMRLSGHGVFIVTCGAGATRGFKDWAEVAAAGAGSQFGGDQSLFEELRARERILWFRAEWTAATGGNFNTLEVARSASRDIDDLGAQMLNHPVGRAKPDGRLGTVENNGQYHRTPSTTVSYFGAFKWIQRLDHQPPKW